MAYLVKRWCFSSKLVGSNNGQEESVLRQWEKMNYGLGNYTKLHGSFSSSSESIMWPNSFSRQLINSAMTQMQIGLILKK
jgi:hypothetical protein